MCYACVRAEEFRLAGVCGLHILKHPDHVEELIQHYERAGHPTELIQLMEQGLGLEEAHSGVFTELAVLYTKYGPEKLMEHIKIFWSRCNVTKVGVLFWCLIDGVARTERSGQELVSLENKLNLPPQ